MKYAFLIMGEFSPQRDHAAFPGGDIQMIGVSNLEEAGNVAKKLLEQDVACIELCGAFEESGARAVIEATEGKIPVGFVTHFPEQDSLFQTVFG